MESSEQEDPTLEDREDEDDVVDDIVERVEELVNEELGDDASFEEYEQAVLRITNEIARRRLQRKLQGLADQYPPQLRIDHNDDWHGWREGTAHEFRKHLPASPATTASWVRSRSAARRSFAFSDQSVRRTPGRWRPPGSVDPDTTQPAAFGRLVPRGRRSWTRAARRPGPRAHGRRASTSVPTGGTVCCDERGRQARAVAVGSVLGSPRRGDPRSARAPLRLLPTRSAASQRRHADGLHAFGSRCSRFRGGGSPRCGSLALVGAVAHCIRSPARGPRARRLRGDHRARRSRDRGRCVRPTGNGRVRGGEGRDPRASSRSHDELGLGFLWAGCTIPEARGHGFYSAVLAERVAWARARRLQWVGLYAVTTTSSPIVARRGFGRFGAMTYWERMPHVGAA